MNRSPIPWPLLLRRYPGQTTGERFQSALQGKTFRQLAEELGRNISTVKAAAYRHQAVSFFKGENLRREHACSEPRLDYAGVLGAIISMLATEKGVTESDYREWIKEAGQGEFAGRCFQMRIPLFVCRYQEIL